MTNALLKETKISYLPGSPGVPASPGSPAIPAHYSYENKYVCGFGSLDSSKGSYRFVTDEMTGEVRYVFVPADPGSYVPYGYSCSMKQVLVYVPATPYIAPTPGIPPTPAQIFSDFNLGWNSGARSIASFQVNGYASFMAQTSVLGVVAGLSDANPNADYRSIRHAFHLSRGVARIYESGVDLIYAGTYTAASTFRIERRNGQVRYLMDGSVVYTSLQASRGELFLDSSLYAGGDAVQSPAIAGTSAGGTASLSLLPLSLIAGTGSYARTGPSMSFQPLVLEAREAVKMRLAFEPMKLLAGDRRYGEARMSLAPMTLSAGQYDQPPTYALASMSLCMLTLGATGKTGGLARVSASMAPLSLLAGEGSYAEVRAAFAPLQMYAHAYEGNTNATLLGLASARSTLRFFGSVDVQLLSSAGMTTTLATLVLKDAAIAEAADVAGTMSYSAIMQALLATVVRAFAGIPVLTQDGEVWVVNDESGASTSYEGYGFNSFGQYRGKYLGAKAGGVYLLEGATDAGAPIRSSVSFGKQDFGSSANKAVPNCYIGVASSGTLVLKVIADGIEHLYRTVRSSASQDVQRIQLGRGLRANYLTFELFNQDGADFELGSVEFEAVILSRRI